MEISAKRGTLHLNPSLQGGGLNALIYSKLITHLSNILSNCIGNMGRIFFYNACNNTVASLCCIVKIKATKTLPNHTSYTMCNTPIAILHLI